MTFRTPRCLPYVLLVLALVTSGASASAQAVEPPSLTPDEIRSFLETARIESATPVGRGVTGIMRFTLSDGTLTWDAAFQSIDDRPSMRDLQRGRRRGGEVRFVDSYKYNIAAYEIARLLGIGAMIPVTVERRWNGAPPDRQVGALSWWVVSQMDEAERRKRGELPPDPAEWDRQLHRMVVFTELVRDTDRNLGNILITPDWRIVMVDFTRAFRLQRELLRPDTLQKCDRQLLEQLRSLTTDELRRAVGPQLTRFEVEALMARRDLIVQRFQTLIAQRGEERVLY
jgi:hypothetical protein